MIYITAEDWKTGPGQKRYLHTEKSSINSLSWPIDWNAHRLLHPSCYTGWLPQIPIFWSFWKLVPNFGAAPTGKLLYSNQGLLFALKLNPGATEADQHINTSSCLSTHYCALSVLLWIIGRITKVRTFVQQGLVPRPLIIQPSEEMCTLTSAKSPGIGHTVCRAFWMAEERSELQ